MDKSAEQIAGYVHALRFEDLPPEVVHHCRRCLVDTFGVALAAFDAEPCRIARQISIRAEIPGGARIIGTRHRTLPELAAFANGAMTRYLDGNDSYLGGGGHPSDIIPAVLAVADTHGGTGRDIVTAIVAGYEVYYNFWKTARVRGLCIDNVFYVIIGSAVGAAKMLGLDRKGIVEALSLAIIPNVSMDATRYGLLSMWKGCAAGNAARNGVFAALLAQAGMTGPEKPIEGGHGLQKLVGAFDLLPFDGSRPYGINEITLKCFLAVAHALSPISAAMELSRQVAIDDIERITLYTYKYARDITGTEREKWRPTTREAADHSLPFIVAAVLLHGRFGDDLFEAEQLRDARILALTDKITVEEDLEFTRQFGAMVPCRIEITTRGGARKVAVTEYPRGHYRNPMTDDEVSAKFREMARRTLPSPRMERVLSALWGMDAADNLDELFEALLV